MRETVTQVRAGYEAIHENVVKQLAEIEETIKARVEAEFANDKARLNAIRESCLETVEIDVADPVVDTSAPVIEDTNTILC